MYPRPLCNAQCACGVTIFSAAVMFCEPPGDARRFVVVVVVGVMLKFCPYNVSVL